MAGVLALATTSITGCGGYTAGSMQSAATSVPLVERDYRFVMHGIRGEACRFSFLGFGISDRSYAAAIKEIHKQVPKKYKPQYQLVNVVDDWSFTFYLIAWKNCTVVSADVVVLKKAGETCAESPGETDGAAAQGEGEEEPAADEGEAKPEAASEDSSSKDAAVGDAPAPSDEAAKKTTKKAKKNKDTAKTQEIE